MNAPWPDARHGTPVAAVNLLLLREDTMSVENTPAGAGDRRFAFRWLALDADLPALVRLYAEIDAVAQVGERPSAADLHTDLQAAGWTWRRTPGTWLTPQTRRLRRGLGLAAGPQPARQPEPAGASGVAAVRGWAARCWPASDPCPRPRRSLSHDPVLGGWDAPCCGPASPGCAHGQATIELGVMGDNAPALEL